MYKEIKLVGNGWWFHGGGAHRRSILCYCGLRHKISLPKNINTIVACFSDKRPRHGQAFTITKPKMTDFGPVSRVEEFRGSLTLQAERELRKQYDRGARYVWFEYNG